MSLVISEELIEASGLSEPELLLEIVMMLFQQKKLASAKQHTWLDCTRSPSSVRWQPGEFVFIMT